MAEQGKARTKKGKTTGGIRRSLFFPFLFFPLLVVLLVAISHTASSSSSSAQSERQQTPAQKKPSGDEAQDVDDDEVVRVSTSEVLLPVTVRDAQGQLISTLKRESFRVWEDDREQPLSDLALRTVPVDVVLMIDSSSSVTANLDDFRRAAGEFAAQLAPEDRISLIKFDDRVELLLDWTHSRAQLRRALRRLTAGMFTRFNDALYLTAREQFTPGAKRHAVVILSDGIDSGRGSSTLDAALRALLEAQATVYVISNTQIERARKQSELDTLLASTPAQLRFSQLRIGDLRESLRVIEQSEQNLAQLTQYTGGRLYKPESFDALDGVYREVAAELRSQYALYYTPTNKERDGRFRRVRVRLTDPTLHATTRIGYFAPRN